MTKNGNPRTGYLSPVLGCVLLCTTIATVLAAPPDPYVPLWPYHGSWQVSRKDRLPSAPPDKLVNQCSLAGHFFVCAQSVNGGPDALLIFIPSGKPGRYYTQNVRPEGRAAGRGDLEIQGTTWVYTSTWDEGGRTVYYRTTNVFLNHAHIHFEQAESTDNKTWVVKNSGEEIRVGSSAARP